MTDDFIDALKGDWTAQLTGIEAVRLRMRRSRWLPLVLIVAEALWALIAVVVGLWFAAIAVQRHDLLFGLSAATLALTTPPTAVALLRARWRTLDWADESAEGTLRYALTRAEATRRALEIGRWSCWILLVFVVVLWGCALAGLITHGYPLALLSVIWLAASAGSLAWISWRGRRNTRERAQCEQLLAQFAEARGSDD